MKQLTGSCLCGKVAFDVAENFAFIGYCHCSECRKWSGSPFGAGAAVDFDDFRITAGEDLVTYYPKTENTELGFCSRCGSSLFSKKLNMGKYIVRLGALNDTPTKLPSMHIFTGSKAPWHDITDDLPQFDERP